MLETAVALIFAHALADFVLQTGASVRNKRQPAVFAGHIGIVAATAWLALGLAPAVWLLLLVASSHAAIDWLKIRFGGPGFAAFILDQAAHVATILAGAALFPAAYSAGIWAFLNAGAATRLAEAMTLGAGLVGCVWAGGYAVKALMFGLKFPSDPDDESSLPLGGQLIGRLERLMILMFVLAGEIGAIGLLIAAKSVLRFSEVSRDRDRHVSEYVIIGTLASFAWALGVAFAARTALTALGAT